MVAWDYFNRFDDCNEYLPPQGEGETLATQAVTAVSKLIYKWYNDGDVYDNTYALEGWANDLSSYANWLLRVFPDRCGMLEEIYDARNGAEYEEILKALADEILSKPWLDRINKEPKVGTIYDCDGPFKFVDYDEGDDEEYEEDW